MLAFSDDCITCFESIRSDKKISQFKISINNHGPIFIVTDFHPFTKYNRYKWQNLNFNNFLSVSDL